MYSVNVKIESDEEDGDNVDLPGDNEGDDSDGEDDDDDDESEDTDLESNLTDGIERPQSATGIRNTRDVTNFVFAFGNMRRSTTFQLFDVRQIVGGISVECEYFTLCNLTEFN